MSGVWPREGEEPPAFDSGTVFLEIEPPAWTPWVEAIWYSQGELTHRRERVLPTANPDLVVNLGAPIHLVSGAPGAPVSPISRVSVSGLMLEPFVLEHPRFHRVVGLRLTPLGMRRVLGVPVKVLGDQLLDVALIDREAIERLVEGCTLAASPEQVLRAALGWVQTRLDLALCGVDPIVEWTVAQIDLEGGKSSIRGLCEASGYAMSRFNRGFRAELGLTPKRYARLVRFERALEGLKSGAQLTEIAYACGFYDQAHMNAEFRGFARRTPLEVRASSYPGGVTMAEP